MNEKIIVASLDEVYATIEAHGGDTMNDWSPEGHEDEPSFLYTIECKDGSKIDFYGASAKIASAIYEKTF